MVSKAAALQSTVETPSAFRAARAVGRAAVRFGKYFGAWMRATQFGPDRSRELGRHLGARC